jgi:uncharacterized OB-fold protein
MTEVSELTGLPLVPPNMDEYAAYFWSEAAKGKLMLTRCAEGGEVVWVPRPFCPAHPESETRWAEASGRGSVYSYTTVYRGEGAFADSSPFILAYVDLVEGCRIMTNILGLDNGLAVGSAVHVVFDRSSADFAIPRFALDLSSPLDRQRGESGILARGPAHRI